MARLFIGPKEQAFINDITKEFTKDVVGQFIIYFPVSIIHTKVHAIYDEALEKIFENPIKLDVLAGQPNRTQTFNAFSLDSENTLELYIQARDLLDKGLDVYPGDYFIYGHDVFEVLTAVDLENIYGQPEYDKATKVTAKLARSGEFNLQDLKNMLDVNKNFEQSNSEKTYIQQRGLSETSEGATNDFREMRDRLGDDMADIALGEGPRQVDLEEQENEAIPVKTSKFYHE